MGKFKVKVKLTGFELEIEGSRDDASMLGHSVGSQLNSLLNVSDSISEVAPIESNAVPAIEYEKPKRPRKRRTANVKEKSEGEPIAFSYNQEKHGVPKQRWKTADKALWLLTVSKKADNVGELTSKQIVDMFNLHFKEFGALTTSNVTRDLSRYRKQSPPLVGINSHKHPATFYLVAEGIKHAENLVNEPG